jgi:hypothetical protein
LPDNAPTKLECYIALGWKGLPDANTLAFRAHLQVAKKTKCCKYDFRIAKASEERRRSRQEILSQIRQERYKIGSLLTDSTLGIYLTQPAEDGGQKTGASVIKLIVFATAAVPK